MNSHHHEHTVTLLTGDARQVLTRMPTASADCVVTSPPYFGLRDYGEPGQYGLEASPQEYACNLRAVFRELWRVLTPDGTVWLNLGDRYSGTRGSYDINGGKARGRGLTTARRPCGLPGKNLLGIPWLVVFALQKDGWLLRAAIIWHKPNAMPESVRDRMACRYETIFLLARHRQHRFNPAALAGRAGNHRVSERHGNPAGTRIESMHGRRCGTITAGSGRHRAAAACARCHAPAAHIADCGPGDVWSIPTRPLREAHFAAFPVDIPLRCIAAGCLPGGMVLDPFSGSGTTGLAAIQSGRRYTGIDINPKYHDLARRRFQRALGMTDQMAERRLWERICGRVTGVTQPSETTTCRRPVQCQGSSCTRSPMRCACCG